MEAGEVVVQAILAWIIIYIFRTLFFPSRWESPLLGPPLNALLGAALPLFTRYGDIHRLLLQWTLIFGDIFDFHIFRKRIVHLANPKYVASVLSQDENNTLGTFGIMRPEVFGEGSHLVRTSENYWSRLGKIHEELLSRENMKARVKGAATVTCEMSKGLIADRKRTDESLDIDGVFVDAAMNAVAKVVFGHTLLEGGFEGVGRKIPIMIENTCELWGQRRHSCAPRFFKDSSLEDMTKEVRGYFEDAVKESRTSGCLVDMMRKKGMSDDLIVDEAITLLAAAGCALGHTLTWAVYCFSCHDDEKSEVMDEVRQGKKDALRNFILEVIRLYPANAFGSSRYLAEPLLVKDKKGGQFNLAAQSHVWMSTFVIHRLEENFRNPWTFDIKRFADGVPECLLAFTNDSPFCFDMETTLDLLMPVLEMILKEYPQIKLRPGCENPAETPVHNFLLRPGYGLEIVLEQ